jgi:alpha-galactosidase
VKVTIVGGGSSMFVPGLLRRFLRSPSFRGGLLTLMDVDGGRLAVMDALARRLVESERSDLAVESTLDRREALADADFVIVAISVGGMAAWAQDIEIPARHGVFMHIADSIGPGGIMRAFRHVPVMAAIAEECAEVAPDAWILNYTNPATVNTMALLTVPGVRSLSLCSCTMYATDRDWLAEQAGVAPDELMLPPLVGGINHCAGIVELRARDGRDLLPEVRTRATEPVVRFALDAYGVFPYCWAHWVEFYPQLQRLEEPYAGRAQGLAMRYGRRIYDMEEQGRRASRWEELAAEWTQEGSPTEVSLAALPEGPEDQGIEVVDLIDAIVQHQNRVFILNLPNGNAIPNLPEDSVVEVLALAGGYGVRALQTGPLPEALAAHLRQHLACQQATLEAGLSGDRESALQALLLDPLVSATLDLDGTVALLDDLLEANAPHLPAFGAAERARSSLA